MPSLPFHDFVEGGPPFLARRSGVTHLPIFKVNARLLSTRPGKLQHRSRAADALELNDVGDVQIAQRSLKTFARRLARRRKQRLNERDEIVARKGLFQKMDRAQPCNLLALRAEMNRR